MSYSEKAAAPAAPIRFADSVTPLRTAEAIEQRVSALIGRATIRQLWLLFLDGDDVQLPVLVPLDGLPPLPSPRWTTAIAAMAGETAHDAGAASIVLVWERYGSPELSASDAEWLRELRTAIADASITLREIVVSHRTGVRLVAEQEYLSSSGSPE